MNLGAIRTHFKELLNRTDITEDLITKFIDQGVDRIARVLRIPELEKTQTYSISSSTTEVTIPTSFLETIDLFHSSGFILDRIPMSKMVALRSTAKNGNPLYYARQGDKFQIYPYPTDGTITLNYYAEADSLYDNGSTYVSSDDDTNETTFTKKAADLIIYSALTYAGLYYLDEREVTFESKYQLLLAELQAEADDRELGGGTQVMNTAYTYD